MPIIVATIAFGMGINKPDIRLVVHHDLPKTLEGYYQETGRAGRDGLPSECVLFFSYGDKIKQDFFIDQIVDDAQRETARQKLAQILRFAEIQSCRRKYLLEYFGERWEQANCGGCDVCLTPKEEFDATEISQMILSGVIRTGQRFGANQVIDVLRGADTKRVGALGHDKLTVYGIARNSSADEIRQLVRSLTERGLLVVNGTDRPTISVTPAGMSFLKGREHLRLTRPIGSNGHGPAHQGSAQACDQELFDSLRALRKKIADERKVPPYVIFHDTVLREMAGRLPEDRESFARISGVGTAKLEQFSGPFLEVIAEHVANKTDQRPKKMEKVEGTTGGLANVPGRHLRRPTGLVSQKLTISQMALHRGLTEKTIISHLERLVIGGESIDLDYLMPPPECLAKIQSAFQETGALFLTPVRGLLGEEYSYQDLWLARIGLIHKGLLG